MDKISFNVGTIFCYECVTALRKLIGSIKGVASIEVEEDKVIIEFDPSLIGDETVARLVRDSIERLGYKILD